MNQRLAIGAIVLLLAGNGLRQALSPEGRALVGTYVTAARAGGDALRYVLTLHDDGVAEVRIEFDDTSRAPAIEKGAWILDGSMVQMAVTGDGDNSTAVVLTPKDGALVASGEEDSGARFAGLTFSKAEREPPVSELK
jgi:hypothetical protein